MDSYDKERITIRPKLDHLIITDAMSKDEQFQNASLRPILKMQHEVISSMVSEYLKMKKNTFYNLSKEQKPKYLKETLLADRNVLHELRGIIIGMFSSEEMTYYLDNKSAVNKRIQSLLLQRISSIL
jgi:hypothetical protein